MGDVVGVVAVNVREVPGERAHDVSDGVTVDAVAALAALADVDGLTGAF